MYLRKFSDNGRIAPLSMSGAGESASGSAPPAAGAPASGTPAAGTPAAVAAAASFTFTSDKPFVEQLPEKYRGETAFKDIKNFEGLADSYLNAQKMIGADKIALPKDGDEQAHNDFYNKLGRPETADKYNIGKRADGSDYGEQDKAFQSKILPVLHKAGLTQKQFDTIRPAWDAMAAEAAGAGTKAAETYAVQQQETLKTEFGAAYDEKMSDAQAAIQHFGNDDLVKELNIIKDGKATGDNAQLLRIFANLGKQLREDGVLKDGALPSGGAMTPGDAKAQIDKLTKSADFQKVYRTKGSTGKDPDGKEISHDEAVARMKGLYEFAFPPQQ